MGNCFTHPRSSRSSTASTIKDLTELITQLTQKLDINSRELQMYRHQVNVFLEEVANKKREIAFLKNQIQSRTLTLKDRYLTN